MMKSLKSKNSHKIFVIFQAMFGLGKLKSYQIHPLTDITLQPFTLGRYKLNSEKRAVQNFKKLCGKSAKTSGTYLA